MSHPTDLIRLARRERVPLAAVGRRIGFALGLVLFVAVVTRLNAAGYVDGTGEPIGFLDALYYASVTVTTTGYGDISAVTDTSRLMSIILITPARILFLILVVGTTVEVLTDQSREYLATRRWRARMRDHIVICGFGSTGQAAARELIDRGFEPSSIVIVDSAPGAVAVGQRLGFVGIEGNASRTSVLDQAAVPEAASVIIAPSRDDTAVLIALTVREMNPGAHIVAAGREQENLHLLGQGGADEVIDATAAVGRMLGLATTAPGAVTVVEDLLDAGQGLELSELVATEGPARGQIPPGSTLVAVVRGESRHIAGSAEVEHLHAGDRIVVLRETPNHD